MIDKTLRFIPEEEDADLRIDKYLNELCEDFSRSFIQKSIEKQLIIVNNSPIKNNYKVKVGDIIDFSIEKPILLDVQPENISLDILYEDSDIIIVNKPKGMVVHPAPGHYSGTLVNALMYHCRDNLSSINGVLRPGIVHRIDQDTTGALVVCKNDNAHKSLAEQLKVHSITRKYIAIANHIITEDSGTIDKPIGRNPSDRKKMAVIQPMNSNQNGREAITHYKVLDRLSNKYTYIECQLETGRTHQIRVHMASINHSILGDELYGPKNCPIKNLQGQTLHAKTLGFIHPSTGKYIEFEAPIPAYFDKLLNTL